MLRVGLTGGIACGKSYTLQQFERLGAHVVDADQVAHRILRKGGPGYEPVLKEFGAAILGDGGEIDRKKLGTLVFSEERAREKLNRLVHPLILREERELMTQLEANPNPSRAPVIIVDAALMVEVGSHRDYDALVVVYCHPRIQLRRLMSRDGLTEEEARRRIETQMPLFEKIKYADYIIENSGKLGATLQQIQHTFRELLHQYEERNA